MSEYNAKSSGGSSSVSTSGGSINIEIKVSDDKKFIMINPPYIIINTSKIICIYPEEAKKDDIKEDKFYVVIEVDIAGKNFKHCIPFNTYEKATRVIREIFSKIGGANPLSFL